MRPRPAWLPADLFPFDSRTLDVAGHRLHYVDEGDGPPFLFLHGNPTWSFLYRNLIRDLRDRHRCIAVDLPGFGLSEAAPDYDFRPASHARVIAAVIERLDLRGARLMVQDWGGPIGLWAAARMRERFAGLVIGNTWAWPIAGDPHFERFSKLMGGPVGGFAIRHFNAFVNVMIPLGVRRGRLSPAAMAAYRGPFTDPARRRPTHVFPREIRASAAFLAEVEAGLPALAHLPAQILWGDRDVAFRERERRRFESIFPGAQTLILRGAGHYIQEDAPDEIVGAIRALEGRIR